MNITNDLNLEEKWRNATLANNFIFSKLCDNILKRVKDCLKCC